MPRNKLDVANSTDVVFDLIDRFGTDAVRVMSDIFEEVEFGEIRIKVVKGQIESMQVIHNYQPIDLTTPEESGILED